MVFPVPVFVKCHPPGCHPAELACRVVSLGACMAACAPPVPCACPGSPASLLMGMCCVVQVEWDILASWVVGNNLWSNNVVWLIQIPRLYNVYRDQVRHRSATDKHT